MIRDIVNKHKMKQGGTYPSEFDLRNNYFDEKDLVRYKVAYYLFLREKKCFARFIEESLFPKKKGVKEFLGFTTF